MIAHGLGFSGSSLRVVHTAETFQPLGQYCRVDLGRSAASTNEAPLIWKSRGEAYWIEIRIPCQATLISETHEDGSKAFLGS